MSGVNAHGTMIKLGSGGVAGTPVTDSTSEAGTPTIINATAHGLDSGNWITVSEATGTEAAAELPGTYRVDVITPNVFTIDVASTGAGTAVHWVELVETFTAIKGCKDITLPSAATDEIDITTHDSAGKEFMEGDTDYGEVGFDINYDPGEPTHVLLRQMSQAVPKETANWQAIMKDTGTETWEFAGWVKTFTLSAPVSGVYTATVAIRVTGAPEVA